MIGNSRCHTDAAIQHCPVKLLMWEVHFHSRWSSSEEINLCKSDVHTALGLIKQSFLVSKQFVPKWTT